MRHILTVGVLAISAACASTGKPGTVQRDSELITEQEVAAANGTTAYDVISRVRPSFLKTRGTLTTKITTRDQAMVFINGVRFGDINALKNITTDQIREIRYYNARDAVQKFGTQEGTGVIDISTR